MNYLSLFSGAGGFEWFGKLMGWHCVGYVEKDEYCQKVLRARIRDGYFDDAPIFSDVRTFDGLPYRGKVDCITAGFPCQFFSSATRGRGISRKNLWNDTARIIYEISAPEVFLENVSKKAINFAAGDLERMGYCVKRTAVSARNMGADHVRKRFWLRAYSNSNGELCGTVDAEMGRCKTIHPGIWKADPAQLRVSHGLAAWSHRLRALGNGIVPAVACEAWRRLNGDTT